jgi:hypothetical protein
MPTREPGGGSTIRYGRQYAIAVDGTRITFQCARARHRYTVDYGKKPVAKRLGEHGAKMMAAWWSREKGGCVGACPRCERLAKEE